MVYETAGSLLEEPVEKPLVETWGLAPEADGLLCFAKQINITSQIYIWSCLRFFFGELLICTLCIMEQNI